MHKKGRSRIEESPRRILARHQVLNLRLQPCEGGKAAFQPVSPRHENRRTPTFFNTRRYPSVPSVSPKWGGSMAKWGGSPPGLQSRGRGNDGAGNRPTLVFRERCCFVPAKASAEWPSNSMARQPRLRFGLHDGPAAQTHSTPAVAGGSERCGRAVSRENRRLSYLRAEPPSVSSFIFLARSTGVQVTHRRAHNAWG